MSDIQQKVSKIKKIVERLKEKKKKHKVLQHKRGKPSNKDKTAKPERSKRPVGPARQKKPNAVMLGPQGGEYVVLGSGKKKYGVTKSVLNEYVKSSEISDFAKKFRGEK